MFFSFWNNTATPEPMPEFYAGTLCRPVNLVRLSHTDRVLNQNLLVHTCYQYDGAKIRQEMDNGTSLINIGKSCRIEKGIRGFYEELEKQTKSLIKNPHRMYHLLFDIAESGDIVQFELLVNKLNIPVNLYDTNSKETILCINDTIMHSKIIQIFLKQQEKTSYEEQTYRAM